jgi:rRNA maturation protein Nop10
MVPNELKCLICGEKVEILTPARYSTFIVLGDKFAKEHVHEQERK